MGVFVVEVMYRDGSGWRKATKDVNEALQLLWNTISLQHEIINYAKFEVAEE